MNKKILAIGVAAALTVTAVGAMTGCSGTVADKITTAISRSAGSGTRGAFDELVTGTDKDGNEGVALEDMDLEQTWGISVGTTTPHPSPYRRF